MSPCEVYDVVEGVEMRQRPMWCATRELMRIIYGGLTGEELDFAFTWEDDKPQETEEEQAAHLEALKAAANRICEQLNKKENGE